MWETLARVGEDAFLPGDEELGVKRFSFDPEASLWLEVI